MLRLFMYSGKSYVTWRPGEIIKDGYQFMVVEHMRQLINNERLHNIRKVIYAQMAVGVG